MNEPPDAVPPVPSDAPADDPPARPIDEATTGGPPPIPDDTAAWSAPPSAPPPDLSPRRFQFTGSGAEYFRIWIVNLLLSIVTLGIYSAWAKVRRLRYFYGHTQVDGSAFGYHASPIAILKGRLVAYAIVGLLALLAEVAPLLASVLYLPLLMVMPIVVVRAFRFRAANSSWRGIRFGFDGMESDAYRVFLFWPLAVPFTLGLAYPYVAKLQREFFVSDSRLGRSLFGLELPPGRVYRIYLLAGLVLAVMFVLAASLVFGSLPARPTADQPPDVAPGFVATLIAIYASIGLVVVAVRTAFENLVWNHTLFEQHRFESRLRARDMLWLYVSNIAAIVATLGLFVPWARVRLARYRAQSLTLVPGGPITSVAALGGAEDAASAAEISEAMDLDFGL
jgi:uncharacterized membrane protein YjgN (DUF898 family)